jgi:hypothetical protein
MVLCITDLFEGMTGICGLGGTASREMQAWYRGLFILFLLDN